MSSNRMSAGRLFTSPRPKMARGASQKRGTRCLRDSIMLFEETAPAGTETTFHLHRDSDEVAYVLSGEITFKIGDEVTVGGPRRPARFCHAAAHTPRKTPVPKQAACCSCIRRPMPAAFSRNSWPAGRVDQRTGGQRDATPAWLEDRRSVAFLTSGSVKSYQVLRRSARDELLRLSRLADTHAVDEFRDPASATHRELIDIVQRLAR